MPAMSWNIERDMFLIRSLEAGVQQWRIAEQLGVHKSVVEKRISWLRSQDVVIQTQRTGPRSGAGHPEWKGGRLIDKNGYVLIYKPDHPHARWGKYVLEHRLVMEQHLGRLLTPEEVVHHRDGCKTNNQIENLELFERNSDHLKHELTGRCPKWTEAGRQRTLDGVRRRHETLRLLRESGDPEKPQS